MTNIAGESERERDKSNCKSDIIHGNDKENWFNVTLKHVNRFERSSAALLIPVGCCLLAP